MRVGLISFDGYWATNFLPLNLSSVLPFRLLRAFHFIQCQINHCMCVRKESKFIIYFERIDSLRSTVLPALEYECESNFRLLFAWSVDVDLFIFLFRCGFVVDCTASFRSSPMICCQTFLPLTLWHCFDQCFCTQTMPIVALFHFPGRVLQTDHGTLSNLASFALDSCNDSRLHSTVPLVQSLEVMSKMSMLAINWQRDSTLGLSLARSPQAPKRSNKNGPFRHFRRQYYEILR